MWRGLKSFAVSLALHLGVAGGGTAILGTMAQDSEAVVIELDMLDFSSCGSAPAVAIAPAVRQNCPPAAKSAPPPCAVTARSAAVEVVKPPPQSPDNQAQSQASPVVVAAVETADHPCNAAELLQSSADQSETEPAAFATGAAEKNGGGQGHGHGYGYGRGAGRGSGHGHGDGQGSGTDSAGKEQLLKLYNKHHFAYIQKIISKKIRYPRAARVSGQEGTVLVAFVVSQDGNITNLKVEKGSGYPLLDENALDAVRSAAPFPKPPIVAQLKVPISYSLSSR